MNLGRTPGGRDFCPNARQLTPDHAKTHANSQTSSPIHQWNRQIWRHEPSTPRIVRDCVQHRLRTWKPDPPPPSSRDTANAAGADVDETHTDEPSNQASRTSQTIVGGQARI